MEKSPKVNHKAKTFIFPEGMQKAYFHIYVLRNVRMDMLQKYSLICIFMEYVGNIVYSRWCLRSVGKLCLGHIWGHMPQSGWRYYIVLWKEKWANILALDTPPYSNQNIILYMTLWNKKYMSIPHCTKYWNYSSKLRFIKTTKEIHRFKTIPFEVQFDELNAMRITLHSLITCQYPHNLFC